ncbi:MAG: Acetylornithine aminotransferase [Firmicutes bacterium]|nr:Acetylornithine aminotransferase [Bacillota bacterium]MDI6706330.1 aspartate aminotransferase family protein [Bacillota bacterium]
MNNSEIAAKGAAYVMNTYNRLPLAFEKGEGSWLWDADGNRYLDFLSGLAVNCLGYNHPVLVKAIAEQAEKVMHTSNLYWIKQQVEIAEILVKQSGLGKAFFCNSGAEANEAAIKLARKYARSKMGEGKYEIITFSNSFHGRTLATVTATGQTKYQKGFDPLPRGFGYAVFNDLEDLKSKINANTCAVMLEPIQGEGGINAALPEFLNGVKDLCRDKGLLLIFDEVQCGIGRTGKMFAYQNYGIQPDILTLAKSLAGGFPIGAMLASDEVATGFGPGDHASTFGGNQLACSTALAVINYILDNSIMEHVLDMGNYLKEKFGQLRGKYPFIRDIKGMGLMIGIEVETDGNKVVEECLKEGLIINCVGGRVLRMLPPYIITREEADLAVGILDGVFAKIQACSQYPQ